MNIDRREFARTTALLGLMASAGLITPRQAAAQAQAWNKAAFEAKTLDATVKALGGGAPEKSADIAITAPDIAENGAVVPVTVKSSIPQTESVYILVDKNPNALAAGFHLPAGTDAAVATRVKMSQTSDVHAVVKAGGKYFFTTKEIKVTLGGCGG